MKNVIYPFIVGLFLGIIPFGLLEIIGWNVPYIRQKFYGNPSEIPTLIFGYHIHHSVLGLMISQRTYGRKPVGECEAAKLLKYV